MLEDQRFAARRPDVLVYTSDLLTDDVTIAGPIPVFSRPPRPAPMPTGW